MGYRLSKEGIAVSPSKTEVVRNFPAPTTAKLVKSFLGLLTYFHRSIKDFSKLSEPLNRLLRKSVKFEWGPEQEKAFQVLKERLVSAPILRFPDLSKPFRITCDACETGLGWVLGQLGDDLQEYVICYGGRCLSRTEEKWPMWELEALSVVCAIKAFRNYVVLQPLQSKIRIKENLAVGFWN